MSAKAKFDSKDFNSEAFGIYSGLVAPDLTKNVKALSDRNVSSYA
mgnify:CR=1 FL=1